MSKLWILVPLLLATVAAPAADVPERDEPVAEAGTRATAPADAPAAEAGSGDAADDRADGSNRPDNDGPKVISGMSILGNQEAPKSLVIVPWKSSQIGDALGIPTMLDDSVQPVDRDVFLRALSYYEIRSETTP